MQKIGEIAARVLTAGIFVLGGWNAFREPGQRQQAAAKIGLPETDVLVRLNGLWMFVGGSALALGIKPRVTAALLAGTLVPTTLAGHRFWEAEDEQARKMQLTHFLKNCAMLGSLVQIATRPDPKAQKTEL